MKDRNFRLPKPLYAQSLRHLFNHYHGPLMKASGQYFWSEEEISSSGNGLSIEVWYNQTNWKWHFVWGRLRRWYWRRVLGR